MKLLKIIPFKHIILFIILSCLLGVHHLFGQVEHNYPVGPQNTNCDSLDIYALSFDEAVHLIERSTFRFQQQFKISRTYGVMNARYYSCNGEEGYLIMKVDKKDLLYFDVPKIKWERLISSADINGFYDSEIAGQYRAITNQWLNWVLFFFRLGLKVSFFNWFLQFPALLFFPFNDLAVYLCDYLFFFLTDLFWFR